MSAKSPEDCDRLFSEGINGGDAGAVAALYESTGVLLLGGERHVGPEAIRSVLQAWLAAQPRIVMNVTRIERAGDDLAVLYNDWSVTTTGADGKREEGAGKAIEVVRRQPDGTWKYVLDDPNARG